MWRFQTQKSASESETVESCAVLGPVPQSEFSPVARHVAVESLSRPCLVKKISRVFGLKPLAPVPGSCHRPVPGQKLILRPGACTSKWAPLLEVSNFSPSSASLAGPAVRPANRSFLLCSVIALKVSCISLTVVPPVWCINLFVTYQVHDVVFREHTVFAKKLVGIV